MAAAVGQSMEDEIVLPLDFHSQETTYQKRIKALTRDNDFLKGYVQRVMGELKHLLIKHGDLSSLDMEITQDNDNSIDLPPWFMNQDYMNPILSSYDVRIQELENIHTTSQDQLQHFQKQMTSISNENESLRRDLKESTQQLLGKAEMVNVGDNTTSSSLHGNISSEGFSEVQERVEILLAENTLLMEQNTMIENDLQKGRNYITELDQQLLTISHNFNHATTAVKKLKETTMNLQQEKQQCEQRLQHFAASAAQLETEKEKALETLGMNESAMGQLKTRLHDQDTIVEVLKVTIGENQDAAATRYQTQSRRLRQVTSSMEEKEQNNEDLILASQHQTAELESVRGDCEGMLKVLQKLEVQVTEYSVREEEWSKVETECKTKMEEAMLARDQALSREGHSRKEISRLQDQRRVDAINALKIVERNNEETTKRHNARIKALENEIKQLLAQVVEEDCTHKQLQRVYATTHSQWSALTSVRDKEREGTQERFDSLVKRITDAEALRDQMDAERSTTAEKLISCTRIAHGKQSELELNLSMAKDQNAALERELDVRRTEVREVQAEKSDKEQKLETLVQAHRSVKAENHGQLARQQELYQNQLIEQKNRLFHAENELMKCKEMISKLERTGRVEVEQAVKRTRVEIEQLREQFQAMKDLKCRLSVQVQELNIKLNEVNAKRMTCQQDSRDNEERAYQLQQLLDDAERRSSDMASQLSSVLSKQQHQLRVEKENRILMDRMKLEKTRMERETQNLRQTLQGMSVLTSNTMSSNATPPRSMLLPTTTSST